jgi:hypothetical protein
MGSGSGDHFSCPAEQLRGEIVEDGLQLGGVEAGGDQVGELGEEAAKGDEGDEGVADAALKRLSRQAYLEGKVVGLFEDVASEALEVGLGEGVAVAAMFEGVEVAGRRASATRAELVVAMGTAAGPATHGPGAAARGLAGSFVWVSGHGKSLTNGKS